MRNPDEIIGYSFDRPVTRRQFRHAIAISTIGFIVFVGFMVLWTLYADGYAWMF